ncbi:uncharacterized protein EDB91DRAFT_1084306 [Suillus paluster]|uniref:uncharacterized protein n=1 Tax=Suillus paluster TaxID=48578 RepID=UPI001B85B7C6|nr:uncharacterized protein EDB91DRAFT_1084306 [Suillus paluster]KAG1733921.1 hypothetical protein EDB91DRAFT_1084306 [Suillus paluster]
MAHKQSDCITINDTTPTISFSHSPMQNDPNAKQPSSEPKASLDDNVSQLLGTTIAAINVTKDLVPINLAKGILGTVANILIIAQNLFETIGRSMPCATCRRSPNLKAVAIMRQLLRSWAEGLKFCKVQVQTVQLCQDSEYGGNDIRIQNTVIMLIESKDVQAALHLKLLWWKLRVIIADEPQNRTRKLRYLLNVTPYGFGVGKLEPRRQSRFMFLVTPRELDELKTRRSVGVDEAMDGFVESNRGSTHPSPSEESSRSTSIHVRYKMTAFNGHGELFKIEGCVSENTLQIGPNVKQPSSEPKVSQDENVSQLLDATIAAINITKDLILINLAKGILGTVANILIIAQSVIKNKSDFLAIVDRSVNRINSEVASRKEQGFWKRLFSVTMDRDQIAGWEKDLDRVLVLFSTEAIAGIAIRVEKLVLGPQDNANVIDVIKCRPPIPPPRPSILYGRDDLVAELTNLVVNDEHIALIGPGGMGKSSLAKAILNESLVIEKFAHGRFFVTYDDLDPSTITFDTFMTRFAGVLGMQLAGADPVGQISSFLRSATTLIVLDNAETFEEAGESSALKEIPPAIAEIADIPGVILILTSRSRRNAPNVEWITKDIPPLDSSSAQEAFFRIYRIASRSNAEEEITNLLKELEFHPLSINLLANAAQQNRWSPRTLLERWKDRHSAVLDHGEGKLQSLSYTMELSLSSPSVQKLGENGRHALAVIAFLPQGLNEDLASDLLPSLPQVSTVCDVLCMQSLVYRQDNFIKMLAPIRHFVRDSLPPPDPTCLREIRALYYRTVQQCSEARDNPADIIISDHLNIEHVLAFDLGYVPKETYHPYWQFLQCLQWHLPRPTTLAPAIFNIVEKSSTWVPKADCLWRLGWLYFTLSQLAEQMKAFKAAESLYLTAGHHENVAHCVAQCADTYRCQGRFIQSQQVLEDFQHSDSWKHLSKAMKAKTWFFLDMTRVYTFTAFADELFLKSMEDRVWGLQSKVWHWRAKSYYGGDIVQVKTYLEDPLRQCAPPRDLIERREALLGLAEVAFYEGRLSDAMDILQELVEMLEGQLSDRVLWYTVWKAVVASKQGNHALARELIQQASRPLEFLSLRNARAFLHTTYASARIELTAGEYHSAESQFTTTIESCDMQGNLAFKAHSLRGLGEVAFARGDFAVAAQRFAETRSVCTEMGVPPRNLYSCTPFSALPEKFKGWALFLEGQSPFANVV